MIQHLETEQRVRGGCAEQLTHWFLLSNGCLCLLLHSCSLLVRLSRFRLWPPCEKRQLHFLLKCLTGSHLALQVSRLIIFVNHSCFEPNRIITLQCSLLKA